MSVQAEFEHKLASSFSELKSLQRFIEHHPEVTINENDENNIWVTLHTLRKLHRNAIAEITNPIRRRREVR